MSQTPYLDEATKLAVTGAEDQAIEMCLRAAVNNGEIDPEDWSLDFEDTRHIDVSGFRKVAARSTQSSKKASSAARPPPPSSSLAPTQK